MKLIHRFGYYLGGLTIGVIFVFFFLSGKKTSCSYFPNARVLKEIRFKQHEYSPQALQFLNDNKIDTIVISKLLHQGSVDFDKSQTHRNDPCRVYVINGKYNKKNLQIEVKECKDTDSIALISKARFSKVE